MDDGLHPIKDFVPEQTNEFECQSCGTHVSYSSGPHIPVFPCQVCDKVKWKIYSINGTIIYPTR